MGDKVTWSRSLERIHNLIAAIVCSQRVNLLTCVDKYRCYHFFHFFMFKIKEKCGALCTYHVISALKGQRWPI